MAVALWLSCVDDSSISILRPSWVYIVAGISACIVACPMHRHHVVSTLWVLDPHGVVAPLFFSRVLPSGACDDCVSRYALLTVPH